MSRESQNQYVVLVLCVAAFCLAMGLRETLNVWIGTGSAAAVSVLLLRDLPNPPRIGKADLDVFPIGVGLVVGLLMAVATWVLYPISIDLVPAISTEVPKLYALLRQPPGPVWAFPVLVLVVSVEEWVWRGLAIDLFSKALSPSVAVLLSAFIYVLPQIAFRSPLLVVVAFLCGLVWGALRIWTKSLVAPLLAHLVWDLLVFVLFPVG